MRGPNTKSMRGKERKAEAQKEKNEARMKAEEAAEEARWANDKHVSAKQNRKVSSLVREAAGVPSAQTNSLSSSSRPRKKPRP